MMRIVTLAELPREPGIVVGSDPLADELAAELERIEADEPVSRRCACCGSVMPEDVGAWIVRPGVAVLVLVICSRECDRQMECAS